MSEVRLNRSALLLAAGLVVLVTIVANPGSASADTPASGNEAIASTALRYLGTHGGQCWTFMQRVVAEATGKQVNGAYRAGYFGAGGFEVAPEDAARGDIVQTADVNNDAVLTTPHTAIILKNLGNRRFDAIDSNQNWDEMVRLRPNYDPYGLAKARGAVVHIYRIPGGSGGGTTPPAAANHTWATGDSAVVLTDFGCLNLRKSPSLTAPLVGCLPTGSGVTTNSPATNADGYAWVNVKTAKGDGWVATNYIISTGPSATAQSAAPPAAVPDPAPAPVSAPAADPAPADAPSAADTPATPAAAPIAALVDDSPGCLNVRSTAGLNGKVLACLKAGTAVTIVDESSTTVGGYTWAHVTADGGVDGWVASEFLVR